MDITRLCFVYEKTKAVKKPGIQTLIRYSKGYNDNKWKLVEKNLKSSSTNDAIYTYLLDPSRFRELLIRQLLVAPLELDPLSIRFRISMLILSEELDGIFHSEICHFSRHHER
ncbi:hypothetical protein JTB14_011288 [Gonioctena quinquepunctata]|nr:hypothetical protein JTB14_011288 [Gonioctena quinquepunctata]